MSEALHDLPRPEDLRAEVELRMLLAPAASTARVLERLEAAGVATLAPGPRDVQPEARRWLRLEYLVSAALATAAVLLFVSVLGYAPETEIRHHVIEQAVADEQEELKRQIDALIKRLDDEDFQCRERAMLELSGVLKAKGRVVAEWLQKCLLAPPSAEAAGRVRILLDEWLVRPAWKVPEQSESDILSPPVVANGKVFSVWQDKDALVCWRAEDGQELWRVKEVSTGYTAPAISGKQVFVANSANDTLSSYQTEDGKLLWSVPLEGLPASERKVVMGDGEELMETNEFPSPICENGYVYVGTGGGKVYAVNEADGKLRWTYKTGSPVVAAVCVQSGRVFAQCRDGTLHALDVATGNKVWVYQSNEMMSALGGAAWVGHRAQIYDWASPSCDGGWVVCSPSSGKLVALSAQTGVQHWSWEAPIPDDFSAPVLAEGKVLLNTLSGRVFALDLTSGHETWFTGGPENDSDMKVDQRTVRGDSAMPVSGICIALSSGPSATIDMRPDFVASSHSVRSCLWS